MANAPTVYFRVDSPPAMTSVSFLTSVMYTIMKLLTPVQSMPLATTMTNVSSRVRLSAVANILLTVSTGPLLG